MQKELFYCILNDVVNHKSYFHHKKDWLGRQGLSPEQKLTAVFRMLAWRCSADETNEYCRLGESTALKSLRKFCYAVEAAWDPHRWATLVKTISSLDNPKKSLFAQMQEAYMKDVEKAFGILQARWAIVRGPARMWCKDNFHSIMMTCIILHNMIVEDEYKYVEEEYDDEDICRQRSRRARARQYELEPSIRYEYHQDRQALSDYMIRHNRV